MALNEIQFAEKDPAVIEAQVVTLVETFLSRDGEDPVKLYRSDPRRLMALAFIAGLVQQRNLIDFSAKMNLLAYSQEGYLDHLGHLLGVHRLEAIPAVTTLRFELSTILTQPVIIPEGTRVTPDGKQYFATTKTADIPAGENHIDISARCLIPGTAGNGWAPGQINRQVDRLPFVKRVCNITPSQGGADTEDDENLRIRIQLAPEYFSVAGPRGAYEYWARTAHQGIVDVAVVGPPETEPGNVHIYPLMQGGELPSQDILDAVLKICDAEDTRPDTDHVSVFKPTPISYSLQVKFWIDRSRATQAAAIQKAIEQAARDWILWQKSKLGRDLNPSELNHRMVAAGAKRVEIASPAFTVLNYMQVAIPENIEITYGGLEDG